MTPPTYDEIRAAAVPCRGGCGKLLAGDWGPRWMCVRCAHLFQQPMALPATNDDRFRRAQPDAHEGGME